MIYLLGICKFRMRNRILNDGSKCTFEQVDESLKTYKVKSDFSLVPGLCAIALTTLALRLVNSVRNDEVEIMNRTSLRGKRSDEPACGRQEVWSSSG